MRDTEIIRRQPFFAGLRYVGSNANSHCTNDKTCEDYLSGFAIQNVSPFQ